MLTQQQVEDRKCSIEDCERVHYAKDYCSMHYRRYKAHGNPHILLPPNPNPFPVPFIPSMQEHFESKFKRGESNHCWLWGGAKDKNGYGDFNFHTSDKPKKYKKLKAHRISYEFYISEIPNGLFVLHKCDNPPCINPYHLFLGTAADNSQDMIKKGRGMIGERNNKTKLTIEQVKEIRNSNLGCHRLGKLYNVSKSTILAIKNEKIWRHVC